MNIMLVTVSERTREIGLRKALGATRLRIMIDFLMEGCVLAFVSGLVGLMIAFGLSSALKLVKMPDMFPGLPVSGATTCSSFRGARSNRHSLGPVSRLARGLADTGGSAKRRTLTVTLRFSRRLLWVPEHFGGRQPTSNMKPRRAERLVKP